MCQYCNNNIEKQIESMLIKGVKEEEIIKILAEVRQDMSLSVLNDLLNRGFSKVIWHTSNSDYAIYDVCSQLNNREWDLPVFINDTNYEAPIFSHSHVQCLCEIEVQHANGEIVKVNWAGVV